MIDHELTQLALYRALDKRKTPTSRTLAGLLIPLAADAREVLEYVRSTQPAFTRHNIQHSWTIVDRIGRLLPKTAVENLSPTELFLFILAAAFHDVGMIGDPKTSATKAREEHHRRSAEFLAGYFDKKLGALSETRSRLLSNLQFIVESHMLPWDEMAARAQFKGADLIGQDRVRAKVLAVLLRIGDLLDADSERSPDVLLQCLPGFFRDAASLVHHRRHKNIKRCDVTRDLIQIHVEAETKEEHELWSSWFGYLKQDVLSANTYVLTGELGAFRLPAPDLQIQRASGATYETWPLTFQIDPDGKIWNVLSTSVYTGEWDFLRELIQNAIDANMARIYKSSAPLDGESPRGWKLEGYEPCVGVLFSEKERRLVVVDNGIGMDRDSLSRFLFQVAESGYAEIPPHRRSRFPSIATFGIGFVSVLTRASRVVVETRAVPSDNPVEGCKVIITGGARDAYVERVSRSSAGTAVLLELKDGFRPAGLEEYIERTFRYPACPIVVCDLDAAASLAERAAETHRELPPVVRDAKLHPSTTDVLALLKATAPQPPASRRRGKTDSPSRLGYAGEALFAIQARPLAKLGSDAVFARLNESLEISEVRHKVSAIPTRESGIIWIPVSINDLDAGIEWRSWHGLIVHNGAIKSELAASSNLSEHQEDFVEDEAADAVDDYDVETDVLDMIEKSTSARPRPVYHFMDAVVAQGDRFRVAREHDLGSDERLQLDELFDSSGVNLPRLVPDADADQKRESQALMDDYLEFHRVYRGLSNRIYQDGVLVPHLSAMSIAPVGVTRALANLTARSRFVLNVNRNSIDETPGVLRQWCDVVGARIQDQVFKTLIEWCEAAHVSYNALRLVNAEQQGALAEHSAEALRAMARTVQGM